MTGRILPALTAATSLALAACALSPSPRPEAAMPTVSSPSVRLMPVKEWPLRFRSHSFSVYTYDTFGCKVFYANQLQLEEDPNELQPSSASYGPDYQRGWSGIHGMIRNFPPPLQVSWRSKDGHAHEVQIDFGEIFKDELIRHDVSREEMADVPDGEYPHEPAILLEVNDRAVRVYMEAHVPTKHLQKPGNRYSDFRSDLILVRTYTY